MSPPPPTQTNPVSSDTGEKKHHQHHAPPPPPQSTLHPPGVHQSHSFSSYHPPPPPPPSGGGGYYHYHPSNQYPSSRQPHQHQHQAQPHQQQYGGSGTSSYPYHHPHPRHQHRHQQHHGHHQPHLSSPDAPSWPAPPAAASSPASSLESPPQIESAHAMMDMTSSSERDLSPSPTPETLITTTATTIADASAASTLSTLAHVASVHSQSPSPRPTSDSPVSSAGPLKKRRKVGNTSAVAGSDDATAKENEDEDAPAAFLSPSQEETKSPCSSPTNMDASPTVNTADEATPVHFPSLLHKLLCKGGDKQSEDSTAISSAMEWLPHGKGWRVLRWDVLCTEVLPNELPHLCEGLVPKSKNGESESEVNDDARDDNSQEEKRKEQLFGDEQWIEAFLRHAKAWGFEEVMAGRDRGSFRHELFVKDFPERCNQMKFGRVRRNSNSILSLTPTYSTPTTMEISHSNSNLDVAEHSTTWRKSPKAISSIFKPRRQYHQHQHQQHYNPVSSSHHHHHHSPHHPPHLHVPALTPVATSSFAEGGWGTSDYSHHHGHHHSHQPPYPPPYPPPTRSPKTIRFRDEAEEQTFHQRDDAIEITPNPEVSPSPRRTGSDRKGFHRGFVSRRGRRPGLISRHATH